MYIDICIYTWTLDVLPLRGYDPKEKHRTQKGNELQRRGIYICILYIQATVSNTSSMPQADIGIPGVSILATIITVSGGL